jgi:hypothetical protein
MTCFKTMAAKHFWANKLKKKHEVTSICTYMSPHSLLTLRSVEGRRYI